MKGKINMGARMKVEEGRRRRNVVVVGIISMSKTQKF